MLTEWRSKQIRAKYQKKLNDANLYLYKSISSYILNSQLTKNEKEEILQQVIDMMLEAQIENKPMNLIIGNDYEEFCELIINEYLKNKSKNYRMLNYIQKGLLWMMVTAAFMVILRKILNFSYTIGITIDQIIIVGVISFIMIPAIKKSSQENSSLIFWHQRLYTMNKGLTKSGAYGFVLMIFAVGVIRFIILKSIGSDAFKYTIYLHSCIPYIILILFIIGAIEIYKRKYNLKEHIRR